MPLSCSVTGADLFRNQVRNEAWWVYLYPFRQYPALSLLFALILPTCVWLNGVCDWMGVNTHTKKKLFLSALVWTSSLLFVGQQTPIKRNTEEKEERKKRFLCVWHLNSFDAGSILRVYPIEKRRREENHERYKLFDNKENIVIGEELEENARQREIKSFFFRIKMERTCFLWSTRPKQQNAGIWLFLKVLFCTEGRKGQSRDILYPREVGGERGEWLDFDRGVAGGSGRRARLSSRSRSMGLN